MKVLLANVLITFLLVTTFDVAMFSFLPSHYVARFTQYRGTPSPDVAGRGKYPNGYFVEHEERGFDIGKGERSSHWVEGVTYPIWSNSFGCFDNEPAEYAQYIYFAGDSFTWGYSPFERKFGTVIESITDISIFKCGVTHTGQRHQFEKFIEVIGQTDELPKTIFVYFFSNDVANDYAHPHTSVIQGWQIDSVSLDENNNLMRHTRQELEQRVENTLDRLAEQGDSQYEWITRTKRTLKFYSLSLNLIDYIKDYLVMMARTLRTSNKVNLTDSGTRSFKSIYSLPRERNDRYWYLNNPKSQENKNALLDFSRFSTENNVDLIIVLIPNKENALDASYYEELHSFLADNGIRYLDLATKFRDRELRARDLYWASDAHFNIAGNRAVAEILMDEFPRIFQSEEITK